MKEIVNKIKTEFFEKRLSHEFKFLWEMSSKNGQIFTAEQIKDKISILPEEYLLALLELLDETKYFAYSPNVEIQPSTESNPISQ